MRELKRTSRVDGHGMATLARVAGVVVLGAAALEVIDMGLELLNRRSDIAVLVGVLLITLTVTALVAMVRTTWR